MAQHHDTGVLGEQMALEFLENKGFLILHKNWRFAHWEVDVIARKNNVLHFIEIKTRRNNKFGNPEEDVNTKKLKHLIDAAEEYTLQFPEWKLICFDILSINLYAHSDPQFYFLEDVYL